MRKTHFLCAIVPSPCHSLAHLISAVPSPPHISLQQRFLTSGDFSALCLAPSYTWMLLLCLNAAFTSECRDYNGKHITRVSFSIHNKLTLALLILIVTGTLSGRIHHPWHVAALVWLFPWGGMEISLLISLLLLRSLSLFPSFCLFSFVIF